MPDLEVAPAGAHAGHCSRPTEVLDVQIDKDMVLQLLRSQGKDDQVGQADSELPSQVDTDQHAGLLEKFGISPQDLIAMVTGGGGGGGGLAGGLGGMLGGR
jgi:hypothetical protein